MNPNERKTEICWMCIPAKSAGQGLSFVEITSGQKWNNFWLIGGNHAN